ncbi:hypothetical protein [Actinoplanes friuliensis]|jgi:hypothetical protein|uniref:Uncharacterized protein n=1 Tax=Actinoplanes friuliensis DSM 7358 TaxID=1246995 RepID=U5W4W7_9ACTN|nr:hypothetical protein [Actinoplanes friuliensis]AGZ42986.1 hypothetical protein AFR_23590 [Actinoplanes friuliensis DSM 7358]
MDTTLLRLAAELRKAAADAGRSDVVAKVDEVIALLAGDRVAGEGSAPKTNAIIKLLDGLGL